MSSGIATTTFHQYKHTGMLYFGYKLKITEKYKYVIFRKVKQSKLVITTWKLPSSKVYHGLNNALGICVHGKHYQVLPTQMVPICENLALGPWTNVCVTHLNELSFSAKRPASIVLTCIRPDIFSRSIHYGSDLRYEDVCMSVTFWIQGSQWSMKSQWKTYF